VVTWSQILKAYGANNLGVTDKVRRLPFLIDTFPLMPDLTELGLRTACKLAK